MRESERAGSHPIQVFKEMGTLVHNHKGLNSAINLHELGGLYPGCEGRGQYKLMIDDLSIDFKPYLWNSF